MDEYLYLRQPPDHLRRQFEFDTGGAVWTLREADTNVEALGKDGVARLRLSAPLARAADGKRRRGTVQIVGRTMFDYGYPYWGENPPFHAPVFVLTHRGQERIEKSGGTSYTFVTGGIKAAVEQARAVADGRDVLLAGGVSVAQQALAAGLVDEVQLHVAPLLAGRGLRLFGDARADLRCVETIRGEGAVHLRYEVR